MAPASPVDPESLSKMTAFQADHPVSHDRVNDWRSSPERQKHQHHT